MPPLARVEPHAGPGPDTDDLIIETDIAYSGGPRAKTLVLARRRDRSGLLPAVVHFHGGGWRKGGASDKTAGWLARAGFIGISVNYRLSQEALFPAAVHDGKAAIRWARAHAATYGIDPERIGVFGGSAGGHLAALIGTSAGDAFLEGDGPHAEYPSRVQAVVDNYGPTDFLQMNDAPGKMDHNRPDSPESAFIGGPIQERPQLVRKANPIRYASASAPPTLIVHGKNDMAVPYHQSELLCAALEAVGAIVRLVPVENAGHGFKPHPEGAIIRPSRREIEALQLDWFRQHLDPPQHLNAEDTSVK